VAVVENGAQERAWLTRRPLSLVHSTTRQPDRHFLAYF
jgi:hypothetical protein